MSTLANCARANVNVGTVSATRRVRPRLDQASVLAKGAEK
jgi:hypothetical protein